MTLTEYITSEFGIVPDEVQLETIRELVNGERIDKIVKNMDRKVPEPLPKWCKVGNKEYCWLHNHCQECTDNNDIK